MIYTSNYGSMKQKKKQKFLKLKTKIFKNFFFKTMFLEQNLGFKILMHIKRFS